MIIARKLKTHLSSKFFNAYLTTFSNKTVCTNDTPEEMMASSKNENGWFEWKLLKGTLREREYQNIEREFKVKFPKSFIDWHKEYFFLGADVSILTLPISNPKLPLKHVKDHLNWFIGEKLIAHQLYPFGDDGNDTGSLVFDERTAVKENEFPIRVYDHEFGGDLEGLSEIIFSSFTKLLECLVHFMTELKTRKDFEIIPEFFQIDPTGAGKTGIDYWLSWVSMLKANFEEFGGST